MEGWKIIQQCELSPGTGLYGKRLFISEIEQLTAEQFNHFCRTYLHLDEFHTFAKNLYYTEDTDFIEQHSAELQKLPDIDFNAPVTFHRIK
jgi:GGDEF domain-containing protein